MSLTRWRSESRGYMLFPDIGKYDPERDGLITKPLREAGWRILLLNKVLMSHGPNIWECLRHQHFTTLSVLKKSAKDSITGQCALKNEAALKQRATATLLSSHDSTWQETQVRCYDV